MYQPTTSVFIIIRVCFVVVFLYSCYFYWSNQFYYNKRRNKGEMRKKTLESKPSSTFIRWSASQFHSIGTIFINFSWFFRIASDRPKLACVKCCKSELFYLVDMHFICLLEYFFVIFCYETHIHTQNVGQRLPCAPHMACGVIAQFPISLQHVLFCFDCGYDSVLNIYNLFWKLCLNLNVYVYKLQHPISSVSLWIVFNHTLC